MRRRAVTLIETLAVVALIALVSGLLARAVAASGPERELRQAVAAIHQTDQTARQLARSLGPVTVSRNSDGLSISSANGELLVSRSLPSGWVIHASGRLGDEPLYRIDALGRSNDAVLRLGGPEQTGEVRIHGLIGQCVEVSTP